MSDNKHTGEPISFFGLLAIVFITLKLCGVIKWSWWWVTAPLWGGLAMGMVAIAIICIAEMIKLLRK